MRKTETRLETTRKKRRREILVLLLALAVILSTAAALIVPALTLESEPASGEEPMQSIEEAADKELSEEETEIPASDSVSESSPLALQAGPSEGTRLLAPSRYAANTKELTLAAVRLEGGELKAGQFTFYLYDENQSLIDEAQNDADGNITFTVPVVNAGISHDTVTQKCGGDPDITYDDNSYPITIAVEDGNTVSSEFNSNVYYGLNVMSGSIYSNMTYRFYMSETPGGQDYRVMCIDHGAKPAPAKADTQVYWVAEVDPSEEMLLSCVCNQNGTSGGDTYTAYDGWCDDLRVNLKKLMYAITYGSAAQTTDLTKQTLAWHMTQGSSSVPYKNIQYIQALLRSTTVPSGYQLVLFHPSDGTYQSFVAILPATQTKEIKAESVAFVNHFTPQTRASQVTVQIKAGKLLDGRAPGDGHVFTFELLENGVRVAQANNDAQGNIVFPLEYTEAGTHTYTAREMNDGQVGINYDTAAFAVTVQVTEEDFYDLSGTAYYSIQGSDQGYYMSRSKGGADFPVYCIDILAQAPTTSGSNVTYSVVEAPNSGTLEDYVTYNRYESRLAENLRRLFYYLEVHDGEYIPALQKNLDEVTKKNIIWAATSPYNKNYDEWLAEVYARQIPDDYQLVLFVPKGYVHGTYSTPQPLLGAVGGAISYPDESGILFRNTSVVVGYRLPDTGGSGTLPVIAVGLLLMAGAAMGLFFGHRRSGGISEVSH